MAAISGSSDTRVRVEALPDGDTTWIAIRGEVDIANVDHLDATLDAIELDGATSVHIDAADLTFFDVAALRCLTEFADTVRQTGRDLTTRGATPTLHSVARELALHEELGLS